MTTDTALIEKREELKRKLTAGEYKTLADVFLVSSDQAFQKITGRSKPLSIWLIFTSSSLALIVVGLAAIYVAGDWTNLLRYFDLLELTYGIGILWMILNSIMSISTLIAID